MTAHPNPSTCHSSGTRCVLHMTIPVMIAMGTSSRNQNLAWAHTHKRGRGATHQRSKGRAGADAPPRNLQDLHEEVRLVHLLERHATRDVVWEQVHEDHLAHQDCGEKTCKNGIHLMFSQRLYTRSSSPRRYSSSMYSTLPDPKNMTVVASHIACRTRCNVPYTADLGNHIHRLASSLAPFHW
jgi:hypothetical protein